MSKESNAYSGNLTPEERELFRDASRGSERGLDGYTDPVVQANFERQVAERVGYPVGASKAEIDAAYKRRDSALLRNRWNQIGEDPIGTMNPAYMSGWTPEFASKNKRRKR